MRTLISFLISLGCTSTAFAASGADQDGTGIFFWLFVGLASMIISFQFIPGILMFVGMAKGIFSKTVKGEC